MFDTPWKLTNWMSAIFIHPYVSLIFLINGIPLSQGWRFFGVPVIQKHRLSAMSFGPGLCLRSSVRSNPLGPNHPVILATWQAGACLEVGANFAMTGGALCSSQRITIGDNVAVGANTSIVDTDFHPLSAYERRLSPGECATAPVVIEDDVFIGMNCMILKGVRIGKGTVLGAGSVVTRDIPPCVIAAGNPARVIRDL